MNLNFFSLTPDKWNDFEQLFGTHGAYGGCWCMFWRHPRKHFGEGCKSQNKQDMKSLVFSWTIPGSFAYADSLAVGWCSIASREDFSSMERSRTLKRMDDRSVWSIVCFFVQKDFHGKGMMGELIQEAIEYAKQKGAQIIEDYPDIPERKRPPVEMYMGSLNTFLTAGFYQVAKAGLHVIVRRQL
jgi:GNAT superfamily N-acetyltransferase